MGMSVYIAVSMTKMNTTYTVHGKILKIWMASFENKEKVTLDVMKTHLRSILIKHSLNIYLISEILVR